MLQLFFVKGLYMVSVYISGGGKEHKLLVVLIPPRFHATRNGEAAPDRFGDFGAGPYLPSQPTYGERGARTWHA
jgi:hypothetical protein